MEWGQADQCQTAANKISGQFQTEANHMSGQCQTGANQISDSVKLQPIRYQTVSYRSHSDVRPFFLPNTEEDWI